MEIRMSGKPRVSWGMANVRLSFLCALMLVPGSGVFAAESTTWGPAIGSRVEIDAPDHANQRQSLESLSGANGLLIFFNRSADW